MDGGRIVADDPPETIRARAGGAVVRCRASVPPVMASILPGVRDAAADGAELRFVTTDAAATVRRLLDADPNLADLRVHDATLEDAIASLLVREERTAA